jgi:hypothetical protein
LLGTAIEQPDRPMEAKEGRLQPLPGEDNRRQPVGPDPVEERKHPRKEDMGQVGQEEQQDQGQLEEEGEAHANHAVSPGHQGPREGPERMEGMASRALLVKTNIQKTSNDI